jgi:hypothetical protein
MPVLFRVKEYSAIVTDDPSLFPGCDDGVAEKRTSARFFSITPTSAPHIRGSVSTLTYHFVWCPKYRRKVLTGQVETVLRCLMREKAAELNCEIAALEVRPD